MLRKVILLLPLLFLVGCSALQKSASIKHGHAPEHKHDVATQDPVKKVLYSQYAKWKNVKYRKGGLSKKGIDCSGFVYVTFLSKFDIKLPRTTEEMSHMGTKVSQQSLKTGDLVFFKTGVFSRHVGIYLEKRKFMHVSTSNGVTISSLDNYYWSKKYWKSIRIATNLRLPGD